MLNEKSVCQIFHFWYFHHQRHSSSSREYNPIQYLYYRNGILNLSGAQESIPMYPGGQVRQPYSKSVSSPRLFNNSSTEAKTFEHVYDIVGPRRSDQRFFWCQSFCLQKVTYPRHSSTDPPSSFLKAVWHEIFDSGFFHESVSSRPPSIPLESFWIFSKIRRNIRELIFITGVNDTGDKLFSGVNDTGEKFIAGVVN